MLCRQKCHYIPSTRLPLITQHGLAHAFLTFFLILNQCISQVELVVSTTTAQAKCEVFDPFKVQPDNYKYQIGGAFPLHQPDCLELNPWTVQEIVAVQWALSHWNQHQASAKLGFFAGDSCSRPKEAVSQALRFLDSVGYHEPMECQQKQIGGRLAATSQLAGMLAPKDIESARAVANVLKPTQVPVVAYTTLALQQFIDQNLQNVISTAPTVDSYLRVLVRLLQLLKSNLVAVVDGEEVDPKVTAQLTEHLKGDSIYVSEVVAFDHAMLSKVLTDSDAQIIVSLVSASRLKRRLNIMESLVKSKKVWITLEMGEDEEQGNDEADFLVNVKVANPEEIKLQLISIRARHSQLTEFNAYFLRVLMNNYDSFSLLTSYVQQVFNCSIKASNSSNRAEFMECPHLESKQLLQLHRPSQRVVPLLKAVYALALAAKRIESDPRLKGLCENPSSSIECYESIVDQVQRLNYEFGAEDPSELRGQALRFHRSDAGSQDQSAVVLLSDIPIEAVLVEREGRDGAMLYKMLEMRTEREPKFIVHSVPTKLRSIRSICQSHRPNCGKCSFSGGEGGASLKKMDEDSIFLSNPQPYSLYLAGLFDFHEGPNCEILLRGNVGLPLAFAYTMWSLKSRAGQMNLLSGVDFGAILVDSCSSDRTVMEFLVDSENNCYQFAQADRNFTVVPGSTFGYISTSSIPSSDLSGSTAPPPSVIQRFFASKNSPAPVVSIDGDQAANKGQLFSTMPSHAGLAQALVKYLRRVRWEYVNVVLDREDADSMGQFHQFELHSKGICIAHVINVLSASTSHSAIDNNANATVLFTRARVAADYMSGRLRHGGGNDFDRNSAVVHVMVGDAHDFYLLDPTNLEHYSGTVSIQPKDVVHPDFRQWLEGITPLTLPETWFWRHVEEYWHCALSLKNKDLYQGRMCTGDELLNVPQMGRMTKAGYLSKSVEILLLAADQVHKKLCPEQSGICVEFAEHGRLYIRNMLAEMVVEEEFEVLEFQPADHHGNFAYNILANYSARAGFHQLDSYKPYLNGIQLTDQQPITSRCLSPLCKCSLATTFSSQRRFSPSSADKINEDKQEETFHGSYIKKVPASANNPEELLVYDADFEPLSEDEWPSSDAFRYVFLSLTTIFSVIAVATLVLVCVKMYFRIVKGNQSLGILLLLGIIMLYTSSYAFVADPSDVTCRCRIIMHAMAHTLCFGVMIVKAVQLNNAETLGVVQGHQLSYWNYWLLMLFVLAVQLAVCLRWLAEPLSTIEPSAAPSRLRCSYSSSHFFLAEAYSFLLLLLSLFLNTLNRNIKRNYKEAKWLFGASLACAIVMTAWIFFQAFASPLYIDYITILELYLCGTILLTFLFGPKIYVLLSYEPVIVECTYGTNNGMAAQKQFDLFEAEWTPSRATSPTLSSRTASPANGGGMSSSNSEDGTSSSIFQTVLRKKNHIRRSQSETEPNLKSAHGTRLPVIAVSSLATANVTNTLTPPPSYRRH